MSTFQDQDTAGSSYIYIDSDSDSVMSVQTTVSDFGFELENTEDEFDDFSLVRKGAFMRNFYNDCLDLPILACECKWIEL